jgi:hypothetical protein
MAGILEKTWSILRGAVPNKKAGRRAPVACVRQMLPIQ